ncbi:hypothetical protein [Syntrophomonas palmitatica]|uniref:hypothetical protein n=1 Tax=Syntrophomonas palmitatica TaxID=402877 RepID=UPI0006CFFECD|nr:hypothetical protein [Syntrophomonas palmitatica]
MPGDSAILEDRYVEIDAGIKTILAILLALLTSLCTSGLELVYFSLYLLLVTFLLGSNFRFILKNLAAYGIFIVFPYLCGLLFSFLIQKLFPGPPYFFNYEATFIRMVKIFFIWYIGSLYFFTTPIQPITEMLSKVLSPLNSLGIPVAKHLHMARVIVNELTRSVSQFKQDILEQVRQVFKNNDLGFKSKLKELSNILAAFIANSLQHTDEIQTRLEVSSENDYHYKFKIAKNEILAVLSFIVFLLLFLAYKPLLIS